jgi:hypothetical protein
VRIERADVLPVPLVRAKVFPPPGWTSGREIELLDSSRCLDLLFTSMSEQEKALREAFAK